MSRRAAWLLAVVGTGAVVAAAVVPNLAPTPLFVPIPPVERVGWMLSYSTLMIVGLILWSRWSSAPTGRYLYLAGLLGLAASALFDARTSALSDVGRLASVMFAVEALTTYADGKRSILAQRMTRFGWAVLVVAGAVSMATRDVRPDPCSGCPQPWTRFVDLPALGELAFGLALGAVTAVAVGAAMLFILRWLGGSLALRRVLTPVLLLSVGPGAVDMAFLLLVNLGATGALRDLGLGPGTANRVFVNLAAISSYLLALYPIGFLWGVVRTRLGLVEAAELLGDLDGQIQVAEVQPLLRRRLADPDLEVGFWRDKEDGFVGADGIPLAADDERTVTELHRDEVPFALVLHDRALDPSSVEAVAAITAMALENERLHGELEARLEEVRASRQRIVLAGDEARRRIERDLHDGAQQRLVALGLDLELIADELDGAASEALLARLWRAREEARAAVIDLRDLSHGLHPEILADAGLAAAIGSLAERMPVPVVVSVPSDRWVEPVERAAYFVVSESLTNVAKHATASRADVQVCDAAGRLVVTVADDGSGGANPDAGTGLQGLLDRVDTLGGCLVVDSPSGGGTTITAELPCG